jgi:hypothetical protein
MLLLAQVSAPSLWGFVGAVSFVLSIGIGIGYCLCLLVSNKSSSQARTKRKEGGADER